MATIHRVSSCCRAPVRKFGGRRRQCTRCKKTWRIHPHRAGRKWRRSSHALAVRVLDRGSPVSHAMARQANVTPRALQYRMSRALKMTLARPRVLPELRGTYTLVADGVWYTFGRQEWVLYLMILKPRRRNRGHLLDPVILPGRERYENWMAAINTIPRDIRKRISSFVSDHFSASELVADTTDWLHQLCHFHLIAELQKRRGRRKRRLHGVSIREEAYQCVVRLLRRNSRQLVERLFVLVARKDCPRKIRMIVREYLRTKDRYETYRTHSELTIPNTTGSVESLGKLIRRRTWMLRTPHSVLQWATAFVRLRRYIKCNGKSQDEKISTELIS